MNSATFDDAIVVGADESLYALVGRMLGLKAIRTEVDLVDRLESGLSVRAVHALQTHTNLSDAEMFELIVPRRTLNRREATGQALSSEEADKAVRVARIFARARQVFVGQPEYASTWLRETKATLGNRTPLQILSTESGALAVEEQLIDIDYGMFA